MKSKSIDKNKIIVIAVALLLIVALCFVFDGWFEGNQSTPAMYSRAEFVGEYSIDGGKWQPYVRGSHIASNRGEVVLSGRLELFTPDGKTLVGRPEAGTVLAFYLNHIRAEISEDGAPAVHFDSENPYAGEDMCGVMYIEYTYGGGDRVVITLNNPHKFGNERAVDEFLNNISIYAGTDFENDVMKRGQPERTLGIVFVLFAFLILGTAIFSQLVKVKGHGILWLVGFSVFFAGLYMMYGAHGVAFHSEIIKVNTRLLGSSMMLYMFFVTWMIVSMLGDRFRKTADRLLVLMGLTDGLFMMLPMISDMRFFDTWLWWAVIQSGVCIAMAVFIVHDFVTSRENKDIVYGFSLLPMIAFAIDVICTHLALWQGGVMSVIVFAVVFLFCLVALFRVIPTNINASIKARELEAEKNILKAELAESRIAILMSQIQPHFIYNTLGTIEQLCISKPDAASKLVHNFSLYLRGNFSELDNTRPILLSKEMEHVKHYTDIEQVRFPDITIRYDLRSVDFVLPALSVQPLVENAIKHGLMGLEKGGAVTISAYETPSHYVVEVGDDGVGFDVNADYDKTRHVGIKNIRERLETMCSGTLSVESTVGVGTKATIQIPKEVVGI